MSQHPARTYRAALRFAMTNYGMVFVLLFLMLVFSLLTVKEQRATGSDAGRQLVVAGRDPGRALGGDAP